MHNNIAYLMLGGNQGNVMHTITQAIAALAGYGCNITAISSAYKTEPWGSVPQPDFINVALEVTTSFLPPELLALCLLIEQELGRVRNERYGPRTIDIDILFYNNWIVDLPQLHIPHPRIAQRRFVLVPMAEIAPDLVHPVLHETIKTLLANCTDDTMVQLIE